MISVFMDKIVSIVLVANFEPRWENLLNDL